MQRLPKPLNLALINQPVSVSVVTPIPGMNQIDALKLLQDDPQTEAIVLIGEIGGTAEEEAVAYVKDHVTKPVLVISQVSQHQR